MISFTVLGPPQGKGRPRIGKVGQHARLFTPEKTVSYENRAAYAAQLAMAGRPLIDAAVGCNLFIDCAVPKSWSWKKQRSALAGAVLPTSKPDDFRRLERRAMAR
jgi:Holliday junction resolvase RusA-like endonuclease